MLIISLENIDGFGFISEIPIMNCKAEFAKKLLVEEKWNEEISIYRKELMNFLLPHSRKYQNISDLPTLEKTEDLELRK